MIAERAFHMRLSTEYQQVQASSEKTMPEVLHVFTIKYYHKTEKDTDL